MRTQIYLLFILCLTSLQLKAQISASQKEMKGIAQEASLDSNFVEASELVLDSILIRGNQKTKDRIILRELSFKLGDTLRMEQLDSLLLRNRNNIFNTRLFTKVNLKVRRKGLMRAELLIDLEERWYIFPAPIFELSDRNFNEWWNTYNRDLSRTNYGARLVLDNFRGRNEKLDFLFQFGFTRKFAFSYTLPYLDTKQRYGLSMKLFYAQNKSIAYRTNDHKLLFVDSANDEVLLERYRFTLGLSKREGLYSYHNLDLSFNNQAIADTVRQLNPRFFNLNETQQRYFRLSYSFQRDTRDVKAYPLHGNLLQLRFERSGLGIYNNLSQTILSGQYQHYWDLGKNFYFGASIRGQLNFQAQVPPFNNTQALGYGENSARGYELYVIDGQAFALQQNTLRYRLFQFEKKLKFIPFRQFQTVPIAAYLTSYLDLAYVKDQYYQDFSNRFSNRLISGGGLGVDFVTFYDLVLRVNYSFNQAGEGRLYLGINTSI